MNPNPPLRYELQTMRAMSVCFQADQHIFAYISKSSNMQGAAIFLTDPTISETFPLILQQAA